VPEPSAQLLRLAQAAAQDREAVLHLLIALQESLLGGPLRLHAERVHESGHQLWLRAELYVGIAPALGVQGVTEQEQQSPDVNLRRDPNLDAGDLGHSNARGGLDHPAPGVE
jgi:hypothetical protein